MPRSNPLDPKRQSGAVGARQQRDSPLRVDDAIEALLLAIGRLPRANGACTLLPQRLAKTIPNRHRQRRSRDRDEREASDAFEGAIHEPTKERCIGGNPGADLPTSATKP